MAIKMIAVKCPQCGANLDVEDGRKTLFCQYCGAKVIIQNDNEHIYHTIDDAAVERAETERMIKKHQIEMSRIRAANKGQRLKLKIKFTFVLAVVGVLMMMIGYGAAGASGDSSPFSILALLGMFPLLAIVFVWTHKDEDEDIDLNISDRAKVPESISDFESKNYAAIESIIRSAGFHNIKCVPLNDLTTGFLKKPGMVESITINGEAISYGGDKFPKDASIIISYHSFSGK